MICLNINLKNKNMKIKNEDVITKWEWINIVSAFKEQQMDVKELVELIESFGRVQSLLYCKKELNIKNSNDYDEWRKKVSLNKIENENFTRRKP
tara:strand:+ start:3906 stop:4187 length:282 start_codon:yes stop_codon:yes gene_type:complete